MLKMNCVIILSLLILMCALKRMSASTEAEDLELLKIFNGECIKRGVKSDDYRIQRAGICAETVCVMGIRRNRTTHKRQFYLRDTEMAVCHEITPGKGKACSVKAGNPKQLFPDCCPTVECNGQAIDEPYSRQDDLELVMI